MAIGFSVNILNSFRPLSFDFTQSPAGSVDLAKIIKGGETEANRPILHRTGALVRKRRTVEACANADPLRGQHRSQALARYSFTPYGQDAGLRPERPGKHFKVLAGLQLIHHV